MTTTTDDFHFWIARKDQENASARWKTLEEEMRPFQQKSKSLLARRMAQMMFERSDVKFRKDRLKLVNEHPRDKRIVFDEGPHKYYVDGEDIFTSVTTFNHSLFPIFDDVGAATKTIKNRNKEHYGKSVEEVLKIWKENGASASRLGTIMHRQIELFYNGFNTITNQPYPSISTELTYFIDYFKRHRHLRAYRTEWCVFDKELRLSGSIDMVYFNEKTQTYNIYDWKRSKEIAFDYPPEHFRFREFGHFPCTARFVNKNYSHYSLQLNVYKYLLEKHYGLKITDLALVVLHPNYPEAQVIPVPDLSETVIPEVIEFRRQTILHGDKFPRPIHVEDRKWLQNHPEVSTAESVPLDWSQTFSIRDHEKPPPMAEPTVGAAAADKKEESSKSRFTERKRKAGWDPNSGLDL